MGALWPCPNGASAACRPLALSTLQVTLAFRGGCAEVKLGKICFRDLMFPAEVDGPAARPWGLT